MNLNNKSFSFGIEKTHTTINDLVPGESYNVTMYTETLRKKFSKNNTMTVSTTGNPTLSTNQIWPEFHSELASEKKITLTPDCKWFIPNYGKIEKFTVIGASDGYKFRQKQVDRFKNYIVLQFSSGP